MITKDAWGNYWIHFPQLLPIPLKKDLNRGELRRRYTSWKTHCPYDYKYHAAMRYILKHYRAIEKTILLTEYTIYEEELCF